MDHSVHFIKQISAAKMFCLMSHHFNFLKTGKPQKLKLCGDNPGHN